MTKMLVGLAVGAAIVGFDTAHAYVNYPWCYIGDSRGVDCVFATREQCAADGRNRGFGGQCARNPNYNPGQPSVIDQTTRAIEADRARRRTVEEVPPQPTAQGRRKPYVR